MKTKPYLLPIIFILVVSCSPGTANSIPSQTTNNSSLSSQSSTSSIINSSSTISSSSSISSSVSSSTGTISSNSSSSTTTSSSSSSSSATSSSSITTTPPGRKVPFNQIGTLVAQVVDAKALGVSNSKDFVRSPNGRRHAQQEVDAEDQNKMVKVTETYNPTTNVTEDKTLEVTFTRTTNTQTTELQTGFDTYVAAAEDIVIERTTDLPGHVIITNVQDYEFRALNGEIVLQDWTQSQNPTLEFLFTKEVTGEFTKVASATPLTISPTTNNPGTIIFENVPDYEFRLMDGETELITWQRYETANVEFSFDNSVVNPVIESRSVNASISFESIEGLVYDVNLNGQPVVADVVDNGANDLNTTAQTITINGLVEGLSYDISYRGNLPDEELTDITIEARSTNASISFTAFEGFTYAIKSGENTLLSNIVDNDTNDINEKEGVITIDGLTEGMPYEAHYSGYVVLETITQEDVDGQVDKLYVLYQYTFISFVPINLNERPKQEDLDLEYDGISTYDKTNFLSNTTRQSFVIDNDTGYIYKIENIVIANLSGGCVSIRNNPYPFDMRITESKDLEFYSLFQNPAIISNYCLKDKNGFKYINNNRLNQVDMNSKTIYFVTNYLYADHRDYGLPSSNEFGQSIAYFLTSSGDMIRTSFGAYNYLQYEIATGFNTFENLDLNNSFEIFTSFKNSSLIVDKTVVRNGKLYSYATYSKNFIKPGKMENHNIFGYDPANRFYNKQLIVTQDRNFHNYYSLSISAPSINQDYISLKFLDTYDIVLIYSSGTVYYYNNFWTKFENIIENSITTPFYSTTSAQGNFLSFYQFNNSTESLNSGKNVLEILNGSTLETNVWGSIITKIGLEGNTTFEIIPELINNEWHLRPYVKGTYIAPPPATVTFQPINK